MEVTSREMMHETTFYTSTLALLGSGAVLPVCVIQEATWHCIACDYCSIITRGTIYKNTNSLTACTQECLLGYICIGYTLHY